MLRLSLETYPLRTGGLHLRFGQPLPVLPIQPVLLPASQFPALPPERCCMALVCRLGFRRNRTPICCWAFCGRNTAVSFFLAGSPLTAGLAPGSLCLRSLLF